MEYVAYQGSMAYVSLAAGTNTNKYHLEVEKDQQKNLTV